MSNTRDGRDAAANGSRGPPATGNAARKPRKKVKASSGQSSSPRATVPAPYLALAPSPVSTLSQARIDELAKTQPTKPMVLPSSFNRLSASSGAGPSSRPATAAAGPSRPSTATGSAAQSRRRGYAAGLLAPPSIMPGGQAAQPRVQGRASPLPMQANRRRSAERLNLAGGQVVTIAAPAGTSGRTGLGARQRSSDRLREMGQANASMMSLGHLGHIMEADPVNGGEDDAAVADAAADDTPARRRRRVVRGEQGLTRRPTVSTREEGRALGLARGASMRRRNVWDDVPETDDPPPPAFPFPTSSTNPLPPAFESRDRNAAPDPSATTTTTATPQPPRSPPPSFEQAIGLEPIPAPLTPSAEAEPPPDPSTPRARPTLTLDATNARRPSHGSAAGAASPTGTEYASAPSSPIQSETTATTEAGHGSDHGGDDPIQREDRRMWNADLLAGYTLEERVRRESERWIAKRRGSKDLQPASSVEPPRNSTEDTASSSMRPAGNAGEPRAAFGSEDPQESLTATRTAKRKPSRAKAKPKPKGEAVNPTAETAEAASSAPPESMLDRSLPGTAESSTVSQGTDGRSASPAQPIDATRVTERGTLVGQNGTPAASLSTRASADPTRSETATPTVPKPQPEAKDLQTDASRETPYSASSTPVPDPASTSPSLSTRSPKVITLSESGDVRVPNATASPANDPLDFAEPPAGAVSQSTPAVIPAVEADAAKGASPSAAATAPTLEPVQASKSSPPPTMSASGSSSKKTSKTTSRPAATASANATHADSVALPPATLPGAAIPSTSKPSEPEVIETQSQAGSDRIVSQSPPSRKLTRGKAVRRSPTTTKSGPARAGSIRSKAPDEVQKPLFSSPGYTAAELETLTMPPRAHRMSAPNVLDTSTANVLGTDDAPSISRPSRERFISQPVIPTTQPEASNVQPLPPHREAALRRRESALGRIERRPLAAAPRLAQSSKTIEEGAEVAKTSMAKAGPSPLTGPLIDLGEDWPAAIAYSPPKDLQTLAATTAELLQLLEDDSVAESSAQGAAKAEIAQAVLEMINQQQQASAPVTPQKKAPPPPPLSSGLQAKRSDGSIKRKLSILSSASTPITPRPTAPPSDVTVGSVERRPPIPTRRPPPPPPVTQTSAAQPPPLPARPDPPVFERRPESIRRDSSALSVTDSSVSERHVEPASPPPPAWQARARTSLGIRPKGPRPPPPIPPRPWAKAAPSVVEEDRTPTRPPTERTLSEYPPASESQSPTPTPTRSMSAQDLRSVRSTRSPEYTDLDVYVSRLEGSGREYEGFAHISAFLGPAKNPAASPAAIATLLPGIVQVDSRRTNAAGKTKLKLSLLGVRVTKCPICLSQFRDRDKAIMLPLCNHVAHETCGRRWFRENGKCFVCRVPLEEEEGFTRREGIEI